MSLSTILIVKEKYIWEAEEWEMDSIHGLIAAPVLVG